MLQTLRIKNFALIADQTIEFTNGFNVLVGETGAGKSLILEAISFVLGDKANKLNIRHGEHKMSVQAVFDNSKAVLDFLNENDIDADDSLIVSRSLTIEGKSDCRINGIIVNVSILKALFNLMLDIYAQNENIELLKVKNHINILDEYAGEDVYKLKRNISEYISRIKEINSKMECFGGDDLSRQRRIELLDYQIKDIENVNLKENEDEEIKQEIERLSNYEKIYEGIHIASNNLEGIEIGLSDAERQLSLVEKYDDGIREIFDRLKSARIEIKDLQEVLSGYCDSGFDQNQLDKLNKRDDEIRQLKKKYGFTYEQINSYLCNIKQEYDDLLFGEDKLIAFQKEKNKLNEELYNISCNLSKIRKQYALEIEKLVLEELQYLGFKNCKFKVCFNEICDKSSAKFTKNGLDEVEFLFSANAGEDLKSLTKTISGGEMSRFMLALKNVFAKCFDAQTLIFDEVDTGISGEIGQKVAERLAKLSTNYQLICITHLCQVTAMADNYIFVKKDVKEGNTFTSVDYLCDDEIIKYIAVVSGAEPTEVAMKFASELKEKANKFKQSLLL